MAIFFPTKAALKKAKAIMLRSQQEPPLDIFSELRPDPPEISEAQAKQFQKEGFLMTGGNLVLLAENHRQLVNISRGVWIMVALLVVIANRLTSA